MRPARMFAAAAMVSAAVLVACGPSGPTRPFASLSKFPDSLRAAFNADSGSVRAVILVSPT